MEKLFEHWQTLPLIICIGIASAGFVINFITYPISIIFKTEKVRKVVKIISSVARICGANAFLVMMALTLTTRWEGYIEMTFLQSIGFLISYISKFN